MKQWYTPGTEKLCEALLSLKTREECYAFLEDLCTVKEIQDMAQRLEVAKMLDEKIHYSAISQKTGASTATISRISKSYTYGTGGYRTVIDRCRKGETDD